MYFSPTGTTKEVVSEIAKKISQNINKQNTINNIDFTLPGNRKESLSFTEEEVVIIGVPVYAGRVPNVLLKFLNTLRGKGTFAIPTVLYGNRNYDDALIELKDILELDGFKVIAGGAFIGEHSFSNVLARNRPDEKDIAIIENFVKQIVAKITSLEKIQPIVVNGNKPYGSYYVPKDKNGSPVDIRKVTPKTNSNCIDCKFCVNICPMGSIDSNEVSKLNGICIKCGACIKKCPNQAKYFDDHDYLRHKQELEIDYADRREPELFI